ncbi:MAG: hypothetical protein ACE5DO_15155 [Desulfobacterales bacterium]
MNSKKGIISRRLKEVWEWKEAGYREVADLPTDKALGKLLEKARETAEKYNLPHRFSSKTFAVWESQEKYNKSTKK